MEMTIVNSRDKGIFAVTTLHFQEGTQMDTMTCTVADLEAARSAHIGTRLAVLQEAVRAALQAVEDAPNNVATAEQDAESARKEYDKAFAAIKKKLESAGLGIRADIAAGNSPAAIREFAFRISQAESVMAASLKVKQCRRILNELRGSIESTKEAHAAACGALAKFCERQIQGTDL